MTDDLTFSELITRVRGGDQDAAAELVRRYESQIRRVVRIRLVGNRLKGMLESMDVCQSVMGSFFYRAALGQFDLQTPEDLIRLLGTMARNKLADQARRENADRRGGGMTRQDEAVVGERSGGDVTASRIISAREMLQRARDRFSEDELWLVDQRANGRQWAEIAEENGGTPEALRKKHSRAVSRVAKELGLELDEI